MSTNNREEIVLCIKNSKVLKERKQVLITNWVVNLRDKSR